MSSSSGEPSDGRTVRPPGKRLVRTCALALAVCGVVAVPAPALAQTDAWHVNVAQLYFWVATTDGSLAINGNRNIPVCMDFADAASKLAGAFALHVEAMHGR
jgi:hypothetical protein